MTRSNFIIEKKDNLDEILSSIKSAEIEKKNITEFIVNEEKRLKEIKEKRVKVEKELSTKARELDSLSLVVSSKVSMVEKLTVKETEKNFNIKALDTEIKAKEKINSTLSIKNIPLLKENEALEKNNSRLTASIASATKKELEILVNIEDKEKTLSDIVKRIAEKEASFERQKISMQGQLDVLLESIDKNNTTKEGLLSLIQKTRKEYKDWLVKLDNTKEEVRNSLVELKNREDQVVKKEERLKVQIEKINTIKKFILIEANRNIQNERADIVANLAKFFKNNQ